MEDLATRLITAVCILLIGAYFIGLRANRRTGRALARWVRDGLKVTGGEASIRWLGASGFIIDARDPAPPFVRLMVTALLEPREVAPLWLYYRLRGRRDLLVVRCQLTRAPGEGIEIAAPASPIGRTALAQIEAEGGWAIQRHDGFIVAAKAGDAEAGERLWRLFRQHTRGLWQISVRENPPHLQVSLSPHETAEPRAIWERVVEAADLITSSAGQETGGANQAGQPN